MSDRPILDKTIDADIFCNFYWLKEELVDFCRVNSLPVSGGKVEITERISEYLKTGEVLLPEQKSTKRLYLNSITEQTQIEPNFVCSEKHRAFFADNFGKSLRQAIICWNYKKSLSGHNSYEKSDLVALVE